MSTRYLIIFLVGFSIDLCQKTLFSAADRHTRPKVIVEKGVLHAIKNGGNWLDLRCKSGVTGNIKRIASDISKVTDLVGLDFQGHRISDIPENLGKCSKLKILGFPNQHCWFNPDLRILGLVLKQLKKLEVLALDCTRINICELDKVLAKNFNQKQSQHFAFSVSHEVPRNKPVVFNMPLVIGMSNLKFLDFYGSVGVKNGFGPYCLPGQVAIPSSMALIKRNKANPLNIVCSHGKIATWERLRSDLEEIHNSFLLFNMCCECHKTFPVDIFSDVLIPYAHGCGGKTLKELLFDFEKEYGLEVDFVHATKMVKRHK